MRPRARAPPSGRGAGGVRCGTPGRGGSPRPGRLILGRAGRRARAASSRDCAWLGARATERHVALWVSSPLPAEIAKRVSSTDTRSSFLRKRGDMGLRVVVTSPRALLSRPSPFALSLLYVGGGGGTCWDSLGGPPTWGDGQATPLPPGRPGGRGVRKDAPRTGRGLGLLRGRAGPTTWPREPQPSAFLEVCEQNGLNAARSCQRGW